MSARVDTKDFEPLLSPTHFERVALTPMPWKNGGGVTRDVVRFPTGVSLDAIAWRVSIARVDADGPFSTFPGIDRVILLLDGNGVRLHSDDGGINHSLVEPLVPFAFAGEARMSATLVSGGSSDFNVMTRRWTNRADVRVVHEACVLPEAPGGVLFAARGEWDITGTESGRTRQTRTLAAETGVWWADQADAWRVVPRSPDARLIAALIFPANAHSDSAGTPDQPRPRGRDG